MSVDEAEEGELRQRRVIGVKPISRQQVDEMLASRASAVTRLNYGNAAAHSHACTQYLASCWAWNNMIACLPYAYTQQQQQQASTTTTTGQQSDAQAAPAREQDQTSYSFNERTVGLASFGRRLAAEVIDCVFCFVLKLVLVYALVEGGLIDIDRYDRLLTYQADVATLIDVTQELFPIEFLTKLLVALVEALYIRYGVGSVPSGCTPGKYVLGIRVVHVNALRTNMVNARPRVLAAGVRDVTFRESLLRSLLKNFTVGFLFPLCIIQYTLSFNRAIYDLAANTIVIEGIL